MIQRKIDKQDIFHYKQDGIKFRKEIIRLKEIYKYELYAYV